MFVQMLTSYALCCGAFRAQIRSSKKKSHSSVIVLSELAAFRLLFDCIQDSCNTCALLRSCDEMCTLFSRPFWISHTNEEREKERLHLHLFPLSQWKAQLKCSKWDTMVCRVHAVFIDLDMHSHIHSVHENINKWDKMNTNGRARQKYECSNGSKTTAREDKWPYKYSDKFQLHWCSSAHAVCAQLGTWHKFH